MKDFIDVSEAEKIIQKSRPNYGNELVPFKYALNRVLAEPIVADRDFPPFDRVTMDGIAISAVAYENGVRQFPIEGVSYAGDAESTLLNDQNCREVMTGAMKPLGSDTIIKYEDITIENGVATLKDLLPLRRNIHGIGSDRKKSELLLDMGKKVSAADLGVLSTIGKAQIWVKREPKIAIITSGNELVAIENVPELHQIRKSNSYAIAGLLKQPVSHFHIKDDLHATEALIGEALRDFDILILSGGVSKGKKDFIPEALEKNGVEKHFHKVKQRPGKPFWFGTKGEKTIFALPGNPVSSFMCAVRYILPFLDEKTEPKYAQLAEDVFFKPNLTYFMQVILKNEMGVIKAYPYQGGGSGDLSNLSHVNAFLELPKTNETDFIAGTIYPYFSF